jgi:hypothetical protein
MYFCGPSQIASHSSTHNKKLSQEEYLVMGSGDPCLLRRGADRRTRAGNVYHVFLVPGQDVCFDSTFKVCYSPDNFKTWAFCAYHGSAQDSHGNVVLYTVEPFPNVSGCNVRPDTPSGQLTDSTNNTLSHETFETITDPVGDGWWNSLNNGIYREEIGDECGS